MKNYEEYVSPTTSGGKIRKFREYCGFTQKELGILCGFSENTAQVRIGQLENNSRIPNDKLLTVLAQNLNVNKNALIDFNLKDLNVAKHALFNIEDLHGLRPVKIDGHIYLDFSGFTEYGFIDSVSDVPFGFTTPYKEHASFLEDWFEMYEKCSITKEDSIELKKLKRKEYELWRSKVSLSENESELKKLMIEWEVLEIQLDIENSSTSHSKKEASKIKMLSSKQEEVEEKIKKLLERIELYEN
ncbi:MAG: helix-turn-helix transcriptional regulator [Agathobacter sp.]|nr:helix-turn-helix transcriptional regulator [Agathobacter sp.]